MRPRLGGLFVLFDACRLSSWVESLRQNCGLAACGTVDYLENNPQSQGARMPRGPPSLNCPMRHTASRALGTSYLRHM